MGAFLPTSQDELEADYKCELKKHFQIVFNRLYTLTNLPIGRFASYLRRNNQLDDYMRLLIDAFNPATISGLMCRNTISVGWRGEVYDCDFNQQLGMQWMGGDGPPGRPDGPSGTGITARHPYHNNNKQLGMQWSSAGENKPLFLWDIDPDSLEDREIMTGDHCFGCTAGAGSSCGGAIDAGVGSDK